MEIHGKRRDGISTAGFRTNRIQQLSSWKGNVFSKDQSSVLGRVVAIKREGSVRGLVYTAREFLQHLIFSLYTKGWKQTSKSWKKMGERKKERKKDRKQEVIEGSVSTKASYTCVCVCVCV